MERSATTTRDGNGNGKRDERLTRGQMAAVNRISKKALLVYQEKGLLVPDRVDEQTGYRYYSYEQCSLLDMIRQLQSIGVSLAEIKEIIDSRDVDMLETLVARRQEELRRQALEIEIAQRTAAHFIDTCRLLKDKPACGVPRLEWVPRQRIVFFPVEPYRFVAYPAEDNVRLRKWEKRLRDIKGDFEKRGLPLSLFHNIGCVVSHESLLTRDFVCIGGFVANEEGLGTGEPEYWEEGWHLTTVIDTAFLEDGRHAEHYWLCRLLDIADANGFAVTGHYRCDILAESPAFLYEGRDMMMKLFVPVDLGGRRGPFEGVAGGPGDVVENDTAAV